MRGLGAARYASRQTLYCTPAFAWGRKEGTLFVRRVTTTGL